MPIGHGGGFPAVGPAIAVGPASDIAPPTLPWPAGLRRPIRFPDFLLLGLCIRQAEAARRREAEAARRREAEAARRREAEVARQCEQACLRDTHTPAQLSLRAVGFFCRRVGIFFKVQVTRVSLPRTRPNCHLIGGVASGS